MVSIRIIYVQVLVEMSAFDFRKFSEVLSRTWILGGLFGAVLVFMLLGQYFIGPPNIHSARVIVSTVELSVVVLWLLNSPQAMILQRLRVVYWIFLVWALVGIVGVFFSAFNWAAALVGQVEWLCHLIAIIALGDFFLNKKMRAEFAFYGVALAYCVILIFYSYRWLSMEDPRNHNWVWDAQPFLNIRHFAFLALPAFVSGMFLISAKKGVERSVGCVLAITALASLCWAGGRASVGAAFVIALLTVVYLRRVQGVSFQRLFLMFSIGLAAALFIADIFAVNHPSMGLSFNHGKESADSIDQLSSGRISVWASVFHDMSLTQWIMGHGVDNYRFLPGRSDITVHPHSWFVQSASAWGVPLAILLFFGMGFLIYKLIRVGLFDRKGVKQVDLYYVGLMLLSFMVLGLVDGNFYHSWAVFIGVIFVALGLIFLIECTGSDNKGVSSKLASQWLYGSAFLIVITLLQWINVTTVFNSRVPESGDWRVSVVFSMPYNSITLERWFEDWRQRDPNAMFQLLRWLQKYSETGYLYMLVESEILAGAGYIDESNAMYEKAISVAPKAAQLQIVEKGSPVEWLKK